MFTFRYRPEVHDIRKIALSGTLANRFPQHDLFVYFHRQTGNWSVARWVEKWAIMEDVRVLGMSLERVTDKTMHEIDWILNGPEQNVKKDLMENEREKVRHHIEREQENAARERSAARQLMPTKADHPLLKEPKRPVLTPTRTIVAGR